MTSTHSIHRFPEFDFLAQSKVWASRTIKLHTLGDINTRYSMGTPIASDCFDELATSARASEVGIGTETIHDEDVRKSEELLFDSGNMIPGVEKLLQRHVSEMASELGHPTAVKLNPFKIVFYREGSFFKKHVDSIHEPGQIMTFSVEFPSDHLEGGDLIIEGTPMVHPSPGQMTLNLFYHDAEHSVSEVTAGKRMSVVFNVVQIPDQILPVVEEYRKKAELGIAQLKEKGVKQIGFIANHLYISDKEVKLDELKGADLLGALVFSKFSQNVFIESVAEEHGQIYFEALLNVIDTRSFGTCYRETDITEENVEVSKLKPEGIVTEYDKINLSDKSEVINPKYLMGQTVLLESTARVWKRYEGDEEIHTGNEGFYGQIYTNLGIFAQI
jgi:hypothetical protein